jgi:hypothetical protein
MNDDNWTRPLRLNTLNPADHEHQDLARALKVERCGPLCPHGHRWLETGVLQPDGRVRCRRCAVAVTSACRRRRAAKRREEPTK